MIATAPSPTLTLAAALEEFLAEKVMLGRTAAQIRYYQVLMEGYIVWLEDQGTPPTVDALTPSHVRRHIAWLQEHRANRDPLTGGTRTFTGRSVREVAVSFKVIGKWLYRAELTEMNQLDRMALPPKVRRQIRIFTDGHIEALLATAATERRWHGTRNVALIAFLLDSLARIGEACSLTLDRLDLDYSEGQGRALLWGSKTKTERYVYLAPFTVEKMRVYLRAAEIYRRCDRVFIAVSGPRRGLSIDKDAPRLMMLDLGKRAGIHGVPCRPHILRHTGATIYARRGVNAFALQQLLGHTTLEMTTHYLHMAQADVEGIALAAAPMATMGLQGP